MPIEKKDLLNEIEKLTKEIKQVNTEIIKLDSELSAKRGTLEAKYGALQQCQIFLQRFSTVDDEMLKQLSEITGKKIIAAEEIKTEGVKDVEDQSTGK